MAEPVASPAAADQERAGARTLRLAHRGDWRAAPENSVAAMTAAIAIAGCDGLEFDLRCSADGAAVLLHDESLARVQMVPMRCSTLTAAELAEHGIPTLSDVLAAVPCEAFLDVELKEVVEGAIDVLELERGRTADDGTPELRNVAVSSFDPAILRWLRERRPGWTTWLNAIDLSPATIATARELGCAAISVQWAAVDDDAVEGLRDAGLGFAAWTVTDLETYRRLEALGAVAICAEGAALDG